MNPMTSDHPVASAPLLWSEEYCVGVPALDAEHQVLFELIGMLGDAASPVAPEVIAEILDALAEALDHLAITGVPGGVLPRAFRA